MGPSNSLDPLFFLSHLVSFTILSLSNCLFVYACIPFLALFYYYGLLSFCWFCYFALSWCLAIVTQPNCFLDVAIMNYFHSTLLLLWTPPCNCYELHLAIVVNSTLLLLQAPPYCMFCFDVVILLLLLFCLPFFFVALLFDLVAFSPLLLLYLLQVPMASPKIPSY